MSKLVRIKRAAGIYQKTQPVPPPAPPKHPSLVGKTVRYRIGFGDEMVEVVGLVRDVKGGTATVSPTIPNPDGVLYVSKDATFTLPVDQLDLIDVQCRADRNVKAFETRDPLESTKSAREIKGEDGVVLDYRDVTFEGYGSTFKHITPEDRDGDYIMQGAFDRSIRQFMENPVMLTDHARSVKNLMGHYEKITVNQRGLALRGIVTNSPHPDAVHVRFQLMEKSLKTLSIGGFFYYMDDYKGIEEIELHETSLVVIPANPDASFSVRSMTDEVVAKAFKRYLSIAGGELRMKTA
jgi:HK97 family phage prohead protease